MNTGRKAEPSTRVLQFEVKDGDITVSGRVSLAIRDVNDNPPYFMNLPYRLEIEEGVKQLNQSVFWVTAHDPDDGVSNMPQYFMTVRIISMIHSTLSQRELDLMVSSFYCEGSGADHVYNTTFAIKNPDFGNITLERELDYEQQTYYEYTVTSVDKGVPPCPGPGCKCNNFTEPNVVCEGIPAIFTVSVRDVQDTPPSFLKLPYYVSIYENVTNGTSIFGVNAIDGDRGVPNKISYTIFSGLGAEYIGVVQLGNITANATVSVTVLDVNDNPPLFNRSSYTLTVQENTPTGVPLVLNDTDFIEVTDRDQSVNSQFSLRLEKDGETYTVFDTLPKVDTTIQGTTTVTIRVQNSSVLDYEKVKSITFQLIAQETKTAEKFFNSTTVTVFVEDVNDNSPVFLDSTPSSGNLTINKNIDRDAGETSFTLMVVATDNMKGDENNRRFARRRVVIHVLDINDNAPVFDTHVPSVRVPESIEVNTTLMTLTARDKDVGENATVTYSIQSIEPMSDLHFFGIISTSDPDSSGSLFVRLPSLECLRQIQLYHDHGD
ncbi:hypothetical protein C0Q70_01862 [Pomacea canaliculata]|uniref:Cadherin domain-containing protein n=1 Tax=Pomacea canaliculata TaxID=400727 RepID=A0A2T7Q0N1_POMCA|nr:hypothetical protein C0Q70_01862 [Pomacea canaliculata]